MLFGLGKVPAVFATVIYAIVPTIRLTDLGIRNVDSSIVEAAKSFGTTEKQLLFSVKIPLALPSIMANKSDDNDGLIDGCYLINDWS